MNKAHIVTKPGGSKTPCGLEWPFTNIWIEWPHIFTRLQYDYRCQRCNKWYEANKIKQKKWLCDY